MHIIRYQFITGKYKEDGIIAYIRDEEGKKERIKILGFKPYFFVPDESVIPNNPAIRSMRQGFRGVNDESLTEIVMRTPTDVRDFRYSFRNHYEADIPFVRRFLIDTGIKSGFEISAGKKVINYRNLIPCDFSLPPSICHIDIEVYAKIRFPNPNREEQKIILVTVYDTINKKYLTIVLDNKKSKRRLSENHIIVYVTKEKGLLQLLATYFSKVKPDVLTGWNINFDINYIVSRAERYGVNFGFKSKGICVFDLLGGYKILNKKGSNRLGDVLYDEKIAKRIGYEPFKTEFWETKDKTHGILVNKSHVEGCIEIDNLHYLVQFYWDMKNLAGLEDMGDTLYHGVLVDTLMLREYHNRWVLPSKPSKEVVRERKKEKLTGALTLKPEKGLFEDVAVFDASRYYPNIVIGYNLTPEPTDGVGIAPQVCIDLQGERDGYDAQLKKAEAGSEEYLRLESKRDSVKYVGESVIGYFGSAPSRLYNPRIYQKVTTTGQKGILYLKEFSEELGYKVIYGDSVDGNSLIPIIRQDNEIEQIKLLDWFKKIKEFSYMRSDGKEEIKLDNSRIFTLAINKRGVVRKKRINKLIRHQYKKPIYKITTESGKKIIVTEDHSLLVDRKGKVYPCLTKDINTDSVLLTLDLNGALPNMQEESKVSESTPSTNTWYKKQRRGTKTRDNPNLASPTPDKGKQETNKETDERVVARQKIQGVTKKITFRTKSMEQGSIRNRDAKKVRRQKIRSMARKTKSLFEQILRESPRQTNISGNGIPNTQKTQRHSPREGSKRHVPYVEDSSKTSTLYKKDDCSRFYNTSRKERIYCCLCRWMFFSLLSYSFPPIPKRNTKKNIKTRQKGRKVSKKGGNPLYSGMGTRNNTTTLDNDKKDNKLCKLYCKKERVKSIEIQNPKRNTYVYDLEVEGYHNFLANGIFVHNTDGIFVKVGFKESKELEPKLNEKLKEFSKKEGIGRPLTLKIDRFFDEVLFTGVKKRYAGHVIWDGGKPADYFHIVGFEYIRRDAPRITKDVQYKVFKFILTGEKEKADDYLKNIEKNIREGKHTLEELAISKTLSKNPEDYGKKPGVGVIDYARGSVYANKYFGADIRKGDKTKMIYVKELPGYPKTDVICFLSEDSLPVKPVIDYDKMLNRIIWRKVGPLLEIVGIGRKKQISRNQKRLVDVI